MNTLILNKTMDREDLIDYPASTVKKELSRLARNLFLQGVPFAVNGFLKKRFYVRWYKMWEYARSLAYLDIKEGDRVLDFGGGATLPVFYLAGKGCEIISVDLNDKLVSHANEVSEKKGWKLKSSTVNLCEKDIPVQWGVFKYIITFCTIEHLPTGNRHTVLKKLSDRLISGGIMAITFDYGQEAPTENPLKGPLDVEELILASGLDIIGNRDFSDNEKRYRLKNNSKYYPYTFGSLFLKKR